MKVYFVARESSEYSSITDVIGVYSSLERAIEKKKQLVLEKEASFRGSWEDAFSIWEAELDTEEVYEV